MARKSEMGKMTFVNPPDKKKARDLVAFLTMLYLDQEGAEDGTFYVGDVQYEFDAKHRRVSEVTACPG